MNFLVISRHIFVIARQNKICVCAHYQIVKVAGEAFLTQRSVRKLLRSAHTRRQDACSDLLQGLVPATSHSHSTHEETSPGDLHAISRRDKSPVVFTRRDWLRGQ